MRQPILATTTILFAALNACSTSPSVSTDAGMDAGATETGATDGGSADASSDAATDAATDPANVGRVFAISDTVLFDGGTQSSYRAGASFVHTSGTDTNSNTKTVGPCVLETLSGNSTVKETAFSAGAVHLTGGSQKVDLVPSGTTYDLASGKTFLWHGGETITVTGDGKDVPAFTTTLTAPSKLTLTAPALPPTQNDLLIVTKSVDFSATWTGASSGQMVLYFDAADGSMAYTSTCTFNASDGKATVPAAALAPFPKGSGTFNFYVKEVANAIAGTWSIKFTASSAVVGTKGAVATGSTDYK